MDAFLYYLHVWGKVLRGNGVFPVVGVVDPLTMITTDVNREQPFRGITTIGNIFSPLTALVEALMGFQFNHVGGGTKTRRPITLHMKYNSGCVQPTCYLMLEDVGEQEVSLEELQVRHPCIPAMLYTKQGCMQGCICLQTLPCNTADGSMTNALTLTRS
jgi:hypothetical protein